MANTNNISVDILAQGALDGFTKVLAPLNVFSTNFSPSPGQKGGTVSVPLYSTIANADNFGGNYTTNSDQTINEVAVNLNQHFYKTIHCSDQDISNGVDPYKLAYQAGVAVGTSVYTGVMGQLTLSRAPNGTATQTLGSAANFAPSGVLALRTVAAGWPEKALVMDSAYYTALLGNLPQGANVVQNEAAKEGTVGKIYGFPTYETDISPFCKGNTNAKVMAVNPSAIAIANRYLAPDDGGAYLESRPVVDEKTKATLGMRSWYDTAAGRKYITFEWLGGYTPAVSGAVAFIHGS